MAERKRQPRRTLAQFTGGQLVQYTARISSYLGMVTNRNGLTYHSIVESIETDPEKQQRAKFALQVILEHRKKGETLDNIDRVIIWTGSSEDTIVQEIILKRPNFNS